MSFWEVCSDAFLCKVGAQIVIHCERELMVLVTPQKFVCLFVCFMCFMQCWYMYTIHCERELMVLVTPQKMKNLPCSDPDTRPLPKLDIGRQSISRNNRRFLQRGKFLQYLGPLFLRSCYPGIYDG